MSNTATRLREIATQLARDNEVTASSELYAIADRMEKREAFTKAAEEYYTNPNAVTYRVLVATYNAMKEAEK